MAVSGGANPPSSTRKETIVTIDEGTQRPLGKAPIVSRKRFLRETAMATALVAVPYLAGKSVAFGKERATNAAQAATGADAALDRALRELVAMRGGPPGVIAIVQRGTRLKVHRFGVADLSNDRQIRIDDHMRIASVSKAFSGAAALSLVSKGVLALEDTIDERLPSLPKAWHKVTLRQLLNHTSGVPDYFADPRCQKAVQAHPRTSPRPRELLSFVEDEKLDFKPGRRYKYSNSDNIIVGLMIQAATNSSYQSQLEKLVFGPLGLSETSLPVGVQLPEPFIHGYDNDPSQQPPEDLSEILAAGWAWASGGIVSTPADLNRFIRGYVGGRLFGSKIRSQLRKVIEGGSSDPPGPGTNAAGLAIFRYRTRCGTVWGHTGNFPGYTQFAAASSDGRRSVTVSVNARHTQTAGVPSVFKALRRAEALAVCAALAD
jgi:D-alanyl-D-alanine carboxypeptidase